MEEQAKDKAQEALQDAENPSIPPPAYQEAATTFIEPDHLQLVEEQDTMSQDEKPSVAGPSTAAQGALDSHPVDTSKEKGSAYAPQPSAHTSRADEIVPKNESEDVLTALPTHLSAEEEKRALQVRFAEPQGQEDEVPALPRRPSNVRFSEDFSHDHTELILAPPILPAPLEASESLPFRYVFSWNRPLLDFPTLDIKPADNAIVPSTSPAIPPTGSWRLNYDKKYHARLHRYTAAQNAINRNTAQVGDVPFRQIAEIKFPEFLIPGVGCGATVKFDTHEEEIARLGSLATARGKKPLPRVQKFMQCEGWLTTSYTMEVPVIDHLQASWKAVPRPRTTRVGSGPAEAAKDTAIVERKTTDLEREAKKQNITLVTINDMIETAKRTLNNETWTPYSPQQLVVESEGRVVATYQRASPFAKHAGVLSIIPPGIGQVSSVSEYIEGIIIATATMVGMQDRIGLASGLMEAASTSGKWSQEQWLRVQREWKDRKAKRQSMSTHPYGVTTARERSLNQGGEVGSEVFDDGLGGAISAEEREAARRQQMAWDESVKAKPQVMDDGLAGVISVEEMEAARKEHLAWEERNRADASSLLGSGREPRQEATFWDEKPKVVYA